MFHDVPICSIFSPSFPNENSQDSSSFRRLCHQRFANQLPLQETLGLPQAELQVAGLGYENYPPVIGHAGVHVYVDMVTIV